LHRPNVTYGTSTCKYSYYVLEEYLVFLFEVAYAITKRNQKEKHAENAINLKLA